MKLVEVLKEERDIYNRFVMDHESGSFLQSWEWGDWQERLGRQILRYWIFDIGGEKVGVIQLIKMALPFKKFYWYAPYGPVTDLRFKFEDLRLLIQEKFNDAVFVRIEPKESFQFPISNFQFQLVKSPNIQPAKTLVLDLSKSEEVLLSEMHQKTRYNIRVAQKHAVEIQDEFALTIGKGLFAQEAVNLIKQTAKRQGYVAQSKTYFEDLINFFAISSKQADLKLHIYKALYNKQLLTSAIIIDCGKTRTYLFGGSAEENKNVMAPYLLHWQAVQDAKKKGMTEYDFWGIETASGETPGFVRFKLGFGGQEKHYAGVYDIVINKLGYKLYKLTRQLNKLRKKISSR